MIPTAKINLKLIPIGLTSTSYSRTLSCDSVFELDIQTAMIVVIHDKANGFVKNNMQTGNL